LLRFFDRTIFIPFAISQVITESKSQNLRRKTMAPAITSKAAQKGSLRNRKFVGTPENDRLFGDDFENEILGRAGDDFLSGGNGNDLLRGGLGDDRLEGGNGQDSLFGGNGDDQLSGGNDADLLRGGNGDDLLEGGNGNDILKGGSGNDRLYGGNDSDLLEGGDDDDRLFGELGNDTLRGGSGSDFLDGGGDNDVLFGDGGDDFLIGGDGDDRLEGGADRDLLRGGNGNDVLLGGADQDFLDGDQGDDFLDGGSGIDVLRGGSGNDRLEGGLDNDALLGEVGDDRLLGGAGDDTIEGDGVLTYLGLTTGNRLLSIDPSDPSQTRSIQINGIDGNLIGIDQRPANDLLYGITDTNRIYTIDFTTGQSTLISTLNLLFNSGRLSGVDFNPVPDRLRVVGANDQNFRINVDTGAVADFDPATAGIQSDRTLAYAAGDANFGNNPSITAVAYTNSFAPSPATRPTTLYGIDTELDMLVRQGGLDGAAPSPNEGQLFTIGSLTVDFAPDTGFDIFSTPNGINVGIAVSNSRLYMIDLATGIARDAGQIGQGDAQIFGFAQVLDRRFGGNDLIDGGDGNDTLSGGRGDDTILGGQGNDTLFGNAGNDRLTGGVGGDLFGFSSTTPFASANLGMDEITDFAIGVDKILLDQTTFGVLTVADIAIVNDEANLTVNAGRVIYSRSSGNLFFNENGTAAGFGAGGQFARLIGTPALTSNDFSIVA
jgi:Ca2+-binding RTX toxin-like protein